MLNSCYILGLFLICWVSADTTVNEPLTFASFNIQKLGNAKFAKHDVMDIVHKIILRYDAIFIQEIVTKNEELMRKMVADVNKLAPEGVVYDMAISERLGSTTANEQYAYVFRTDKLSAKRQEVYPDKANNFERSPFIVQFQSSTTRDFTSFVAVGIHTQPSKTVTEINELATVYDYVKKNFKIEDVIMMGDMNAGCSYVPLKNWTEIQLYTRQPEFDWEISHDVDTTNALSSCPYDRFVVAGKKLTSGIIPGSARAFDYHTEYQLSEEQASAVSDHKVIEIKFRGKASTNVMKYIDAHVCVEVEDLRPAKNLQSQLSKASKLKRLEIDYESTTVWRATASSEKLSDIIEIIQELQEVMPEVISTEVADTILYKLNANVLEDHTSFLSKKNQLYLLTIESDIETELTNTKICKETNPN